ncbi:protein of unknown function DUF3310 [Vibrio phage 1.160.O._10N.261.48.B11]|nr:protein of unknown function DUF3310 [Vibrio phage 1.160.O._10N.261.48.B11]
MYYDSIEETIEANPHCTHVLTTNPKFVSPKHVKFRATNYVDGQHMCVHDAEQHVQLGLWVVTHDSRVGALTPQPTHSYQPATTDQLVTAARFDQAATPQIATDRQVGGDHYKSLKIQPIEYIDANNMPYLEGNVVKYVTRHASKNGIQDIDKAIHYLELIKQMRYAEETTSE